MTLEGSAIANYLSKNTNNKKEIKIKINKKAYNQYICIFSSACIPI